MGKKPAKIPVPQDASVKDALNTNFRETLVGTLQESNTARSEMKTVLHELLRQPDTIKEIEEIVSKLDRNAVKVFWSKFGFAVWTGIVFVAGTVFSAFVGKLIK